MNPLLSAKMKQSLYRLNFLVRNASLGLDLVWRVRQGSTLHSPFGPKRCVNVVSCTRHVGSQLEAWHLESFSPEGEELDIGTTMGWEVRTLVCLRSCVLQVIRVMNYLEHSNTGGVNPYTQTISPAVTQGLARLPDFAGTPVVIPNSAPLPRF